MGEHSTRENKVTVLKRFVTVRSVTISSLRVTDSSSVGSFQVPRAVSGAWHLHVVLGHSGPSPGARVQCWALLGPAWALTHWAVTSMGVCSSSPEPNQHSGP